MATVKRPSGPVRRIRTSLRSAPLALRLALLSGLLTAVVVAGAFAALSWGMRRQAEGLLARQLEVTQRATLDLQAATLETILSTSFLVGESPTLRAAIETWRIESAASDGYTADGPRTIQRELDKLVGDLEQDVQIVTDEKGIVLAAADRAAAPVPPGTDLSAHPVVRRALAGAPASSDSSFAIVTAGGRTLYLGCVPLVLAGFTIGTMLSGGDLETALLARLARPGGDVVIRTDQGVLATTLTGEAARDVDRAGLASAGTSGRGVTIAGEEYVVSAMPLAFDAAGRLVSIYRLQSISAMTAALRNMLLRNFMLYGMLAVGLAALGATLVARSVLGSFREFVQFMGSVAANRDYSSRFAVEGVPREIRTLSGAYDHLIESLAQSHAQLSTANRDLQHQIEVRQRAEETLREREEQLRQSQKLEAIGTLAGGVAHDFNNVLTVINSYTELLMGEVNRDSTAWADLDQIRQAATRAGRLTSQLLAFSRKQVLQPRVIDLNAIVSGIEKMLRRVIGEDIDLQTVAGDKLSRVKADPGQLEQVLVNLAINARDAMPRGGRLSIQTEDVEIKQPDPALYGETPVGRWVRLSVADTGVGMDKATLARIFEPFFTTKPVGKGTGLGLSMVYGIVKQSGGYIWVESQPGKGSTFRVYFPPVEEVGEPWENAPAPSAVLNGHETILVAEDEALVRALARRTLEERGYNVLTAADGEEALEVAREYDGEIHLLLTDVIMPRMGGRELAGALQGQRGSLRTLYMSGHTDDTVVTRGVLDPNVILLQKPFTPAQLAHKVRQTLDSVTQDK